MITAAELAALRAEVTKLRAHVDALVKVARIFTRRVTMTRWESQPRPAGRRGGTRRKLMPVL
jgi:hypothetical protein